MTYIGIKPTASTIGVFTPNQQYDLVLNNASTSLLPVQNGLEFYLDANVAASVDVANQKWKNLVVSPASGAAQTDYDFMLGANTTSGDSDEPSHVGTVGGGNPFAYWEMGGDDMFQIPSNTLFFDTLHQSGADFTLVFVLSHTADGSQNENVFSAATSGSDDAIELRLTTSPGFHFKLLPNGKIYETDTLPTAQTTIMLGMSVDDNGGTGFVVENDDYLQVSGSNTFTPDYSGQGTNLATRPYEIGAADSTNHIGNGAQLEAVIAYNRALTKSEMDQIYSHFQTQGRV